MVVQAVRDLKDYQGITGTVNFNKNGDLSGAKGAAVLFTIYTGTKHLQTVKTTAPDPALVDAARKEASG